MDYTQVNLTYGVFSIEIITYNKLDRHVLFKYIYNSDESNLTENTYEI